MIINVKTSAPSLFVWKKPRGMKAVKRAKGVDLAFNFSLFLRTQKNVKPDMMRDGSHMMALVTNEFEESNPKKPIRGKSAIRIKVLWVLFV